MSKKFKLTSNFKVFLGRKLFQIKALVSFGDVKEGDLGGYIEKEENLSHCGNAWVYGNAKVYGDAEVYGDAKVYGNAEVCGNAKVCGDAEICGNAKVCGNAWVYGDAEVCGNAKVYGDAEICGNAKVYGNAWAYGNAKVYGDAEVYGNAEVCGDAKVCGDADYTTIKGFGTEFRTTTFFRCKDGAVRVICGCFYGDLGEFREQVKNTRSGKIAEEYLMIADLMEKHFKE